MSWAFKASRNHAVGDIERLRRAFAKHAAAEIADAKVDGERDWIADFGFLKVDRRGDGAGYLIVQRGSQIGHTDTAVVDSVDNQAGL